MECPRCHNQSQKFLYQVHGQYYCRKCIAFNKVHLNNPRFTKRIIYPTSHFQYKLNFSLNQHQEKIASKLVECYKNHENAYVWAVCGSGKTEIVFEVIQYALNQGHRVCFCVPRKELVKELYQRIQDAFLFSIGIAYGGVTKNLDAQFIVCTMHQLYRFENDIGFDLMIADEIDAFPFYGNEVLNEIFNRCCLGTFIKMSATIEESDIQDGKVLIMNRRYHGYDLPTPKLLLCPQIIQRLILLLIIHYLHTKIIIYVPTTQMVYDTVRYLKRHKINCDGVCSHYQDNDHKVNSLNTSQIHVLVSTTLLERGMTIENVQVIVLQGNHHVFNWKTLIQIAGRVGRKPNYPTGHIYILSSEQTKDIRKCIHTIKKLNQMSV